MTTLHDQLVDAHARNDRAALVRLYIQAADCADDIEPTCFFLTHAYVFALELGDPVAATLHDRLKAHGRV